MQQLVINLCAILAIPCSALCANAVLAQDGEEGTGMPSNGSQLQTEPEPPLATKVIDEDLGAPAASISREERSRLLTSLMRNVPICGSSSTEPSMEVAAAVDAIFGPRKSAKATRRLAHMLLTERNLPNSGFQRGLVSLGARSDGRKYFRAVLAAVPRLAVKRLERQEERGAVYSASRKEVLAFFEDRIRATIVSAISTSQRAEFADVLQDISARGGAGGKAAKRKLGK